MNCLTETLIHHSDLPWIERSLRPRKMKVHPGASCLRVGQRQTRKAGVALLTDSTMNATSLPRKPSMEKAYEEARLGFYQVGHVAAGNSFRTLIYYGHSGEYTQNAVEIAAILDDLAQDRDVATLVAGDLNIPDTHPLWTRLRQQSYWRDPHSEDPSGDPALRPVGLRMDRQVGLTTFWRMDSSWRRGANLGRRLVRFCRLMFLSG